MKDSSFKSEMGARWLTLFVISLIQISQSQNCGLTYRSIYLQVQAERIIDSPVSPAKQTLNSDYSTTNSRVTTELKNIDEFKRSPFYVEPFDSKVLSLPDSQLEFVRNITRKDIILYREILNEAIATRSKIAPGVRLMLKYSGKLVSNLIRHRGEERKLAQRVDPKPEFFTMIADLCQEVINQSSHLKRNYSKSKVEINNFQSRVNSLFDRFTKIIETSPVGAYLRWNQLVLYKNQPENGVQNKRFIEEAADLTAVSLKSFRLF